MPNNIIVGAQWGDEGKGKIVDFLTERADVVVRSQGGNNAGHTVIARGEKHVLHLMPSGILHPGKLCVIGNGVVLDPVGLLAEIDGLAKRGISITPENLKISSTAHLVMPYHPRQDAAREQGANKIGTTRRGIGPAYGDKIERTGLRLADLRDPAKFAERFAERVNQINPVLEAAGVETIDFEAVCREYLAAGERLLPHAANVATILDEAAKAGKSLLFEGAQGTYLDIDHGTYPFVTSSNTTAGGTITGSGFSMRKIDCITAVAKAYTTRVGEGPFPTEDDAFGDRLHGMGREFGATTGRSRRCGWLDMVLVRYACLINGADELAITNLDGLDGLESLRICTAYELDGNRIDHPPATIDEWARLTPIYEDLPGWSDDLTGARDVADLPANARAYLRRMEELAETKVAWIGVGPDREQTIRA
ncbi:MAG: adenylosuccinate synthase [Verrucomicrobiales bacterium]